MAARDLTSKTNFNGLGLAMTGGGARGAYQAGVLKRIGEIKELKHGICPFQIIGGASAGAVNGTALATGAHDFHRSTQWVGQLWHSLKTSDVFRSDLGSLLPKAGRWLQDLTVGAIFGGGHAHSLLDNSPLKTYLAKHLKTELIQKNIDRGNLKAVSIAATNYTTGKAFIFIQAQEGAPLWNKSRRVSVATELTIDHICASSAIPILFQPVKLQTPFGTEYYGDGCLRLTAPLSPVIRLGANRILAIGVRSQKQNSQAGESVVAHTSSAVGETSFAKSDTSPEYNPPPIAQVLGVALNAIFLDHLDTDVEHLVRLNQIIAAGKLSEQIIGSISEPMKLVQPLSISPSADISKVAEIYQSRMPTAVRYLMAGLGTDESPSNDLLSYLLFDSAYTDALIELGYQDAHCRIDEIENFIFNKP